VVAEPTDTWTPIKTYVEIAMHNVVKAMMENIISDILMERDIMFIELKIKSLTLTAESRFIKREEVKQRNYGRHLTRTQDASAAVLPYATYLRLHHHRMQVVRPEARLTGLARAFIKGRPYALTEQPKQPLNEGQILRIVHMINRYGQVAKPGSGAALVAVKKWVRAT